ncbi:MAG: pyridoxal phosphate-dependent aminotransferase [Synergistaceae bacterium]|jgi:aspartate aminotransferase|nr:pyridoxal phosphate-dependent aminotransferase [Synergistaceae bacterium]
MKSERVLRMTPSATMEINSTVARLRAEGRNIIGFNVGEPDFNTPRFIIDACAEAMLKGETKYTAVDGILPLRKAISEKLETENGVFYAPDEIVVSTGAKQALNNAVLSICNPGDEVIIPKPCWVSYVEIVKLADAAPVLVETDADFQLDNEAIRRVLSPRTRAVIINTPNNPSGAVYGEAALRELGEMAVEHDFYVISDEVYEKLIYGQSRHVSIASLSKDIREHTITVNGFSKAYAMTGWRIGYSASPSDVAASIRSLQGHTTSNSTSFVQWAALAALKGSQQSIEEMKSEFAQRRLYMAERLRALPGVACANSEGAFYLMPDVSSYYGKKTPDGGRIENSVDFCKYLLEEALVSVVPGVAFEAPDNVRISYSNSMKNLEEGMRRIEGALAKLA